VVPPSGVADVLEGMAAIEENREVLYAFGWYNQRNSYGVFLLRYISYVQGE
jgi:hypothetical protein